ncbi:MAG: GIY-YIG nuclease family protein [Candidatus Omnitrophota bacterium]|nr:GIY-YIG nuclease family protein [Candidatus Omnitrophota bacterium]
MMRHGGYWLYMIECADGTYYTGSTNNLTKRITLHNNGHGAKYVRGRGPVKLVYKKGYRYYKRVAQAERALKQLTRKEKEVLVRSYARSHES